MRERERPARGHSPVARRTSPDRWNSVGRPQAPARRESSVLSGASCARLALTSPARHLGVGALAGRLDRLAGGLADRFGRGAHALGALSSRGLELTLAALGRLALASRRGLLARRAALSLSLRHCRLL